MADKCLLSPLSSCRARRGAERFVTGGPGQPQLLGRMQQEHRLLLERELQGPDHIPVSRAGTGTNPQLVPSGGGSQKHLLNTKPHDTSPLPPLWSRSGQQRSFIMGKLAPTEIKALSPAGSVTSDLARCRAGLAPHDCRLEEPCPHCASQSPVSQHRVPKTALCAGEQTCFLPPRLAFPCSSELFLMYH